MNIYILPYKTHATPSICPLALLSHKDTLLTFFEAIKAEDTHTLLTFKDMTWDLHTSYQSGRILLHFAAFFGKANAIHTLISELGIDVNIQDPETGRTALHYAVLNTDPSSRLDVIYILITLGAHVHALDNEGYRASQYVEDREEPLHFTYPEEQKVKAAKLTTSSYDISVRELAKLLQIPYTNLSRWVNQYRKEHNIKTPQQIFQEKKAKVIRLVITENMTQTQAVEEVGVYKSQVSHWLKQYRQENNIPTQRALHQEDINRAIEMLKSDMNTAEIARVLEKSPRTIRTWLQPYYALLRQRHRNKAIRMYKAGISVLEISEVLERPTRTIRIWLQPYHALLRQRYMNKAIRMYKAGISILEIAENLQASTHTVSHWVHPYKNKYRRYSQDMRDQAAKMFIEDGIDKEKIIERLNISISITTLDIWIIHYKEKHGLQIRNTYRRYSQDMRDQAAKMFIEDGIDKKEIIERLNIPISITILDIWIIHYKEKHGLQYSSAFKEKAIEMVNVDNMTEEEVSEQLNIPKYLLSRWLREHQEQRQKEEIETTLQETEKIQGMETEISPQKINTTNEKVEEPAVHAIRERSSAKTQSTETRRRSDRGQSVSYPENNHSDSAYIYSQATYLNIAQEAVEEDLSPTEIENIAEEEYLDLEILKLYIRNYRYR